MKLIRNLVSYIFPLTRKITSQYSGELEVTTSNGRKVLDSANANYSYGSLQRILKFALGKIYSPAIHNVLVLGLGGGSVVATLRQDFAFAGTITAVDIDPVVIRIADEEFGISESDNTQINCADAFDFIKKGARKYDLIIVDLFIDNTIPDKFLSVEFWQLLGQKVRTPGHIIFNAFAEASHIDLIEGELITLGFAVQECLRVERTNTVLLASLR